MVFRVQHAGSPSGVAETPQTKIGHAQRLSSSGRQVTPELNVLPLAQDHLAGRPPFLLPRAVATAVALRPPADGGPRICSFESGFDRKPRLRFGKKNTGPVLRPCVFFGKPRTIPEATHLVQTLRKWTSKLGGHPWKKRIHLDPQTTHKNGISPTIILGVKPIFQLEV